VDEAGLSWVGTEREWESSMSREGWNFHHGGMTMLRGWKGVAMVAVMGVGGVAGAHEFVCDKAVEVMRRDVGVPANKVEYFPNTLRFEYRLDNIHPTGESVAQSVYDPLLATRGWNFPLSMPLVVKVKESKRAHFTVQVKSPEQCMELAASDGKVDEHFDSTFRVKWALGETQCSVRVTCCTEGVDCQVQCPEEDPDCQETSGGNPGVRAVTRSAGFYKVRPQALEQCLAQGSIALGGVAKVDSVETALGMLWASPSLKQDGESRGALETQRFELGREALVATCNARLFGTEAKGKLLDKVAWALSSPKDSRLEELLAKLRKHNGSGEGLPLPQGFHAGQATPARAATLAIDPTSSRQP
jgi:hypothetical protein